MEKEKNNKKEESSNKTTIIAIVACSIVIIVAIAPIFWNLGANFAGGTGKSSSNTNTTITTNSTNQKYTAAGNTDDLLSDEEALALGNQLYDYTDYLYWNVRAYDEKGNVVMNEAMLNDIKYHFTDDFKFRPLYDSSDLTGFSDLVSYDSGNRGSRQDFAGTELSIKTIDTDTITFNTVTQYCALPSGVLQTTDAMCSMKESYIADTVTNDFIIEKVDGIWKVKYFVVER